MKHVRSCFETIQYYYFISKYIINPVQRERDNNKQLEELIKLSRYFNY